MNDCERRASAYDGSAREESDSEDGEEARVELEAAYKEWEQMGEPRAEALVPKRSFAS